MHGLESPDERQRSSPVQVSSVRVRRCPTNVPANHDFCLCRVAECNGRMGLNAHSREEGAGYVRRRETAGRLGRVGARAVPGAGGDPGPPNLLWDVVKGCAGGDPGTCCDQEGKTTVIKGVRRSTERRRERCGVHCFVVGNDHPASRHPQPVCQ